MTMTSRRARAADALRSLGINPEAPDHEVRHLLTFSLKGSYRSLLGQSHKCDLGEGQGWVTKVQYLAPSRAAGIKGWTACPHASEGCSQACIDTSGMMIYPTHVEARKRRTLRWFLFPVETMEAFNMEVYGHHGTARLRSAKAAVRADGTSERHFWRKKGINRDLDVQFYDYLKSPLTPAALAAHDSGWHQTFSLSEKPESLLQSDAWAAVGVNSAIVVAGAGKSSAKKNKAIADELARRGSFFGRSVIFGDEHDLRFLDPADGGWVALGAKGKSRYDETGFVVRFDADKLLGSDALAEECLLPAHAERFFDHHSMAAAAK
mgnify:FL=1